MPNKLHPQYIVGFIDGEGSFSISASKHKTLKRKVEIRAALEIELRADDKDILEKIKDIFDCGHMYVLNYEKYGWYPHVKYKVSNTQDLVNKIIPFFDKYPPQSKKAEVYKIFREIVIMLRKKEHLTDKGYKKILRLRDKIRKYGKKHKLGTARIRENRSFGGV